jgi:NAD-dependent dihydropyrimidine dehydrogenase PreA subunit
MQIHYEIFYPCCEAERGFASNYKSLRLNILQGEFIMAAIISEEGCVGCGACVGACPVESISMNGDKAVVDEATCIDCGACVDECPTQAISM